MSQTLPYYLNAFKSLKQGTTKYGKAPHKIIMLLSILQAFCNKLITENQLFISPELVLLFKSNWTTLVLTRHKCNFALPFWHLRGDKFWHLYPKHGFEASLHLKE